MSVEWLGYGLGGCCSRHRNLIAQSAHISLNLASRAIVRAKGMDTEGSQVVRMACRELV